MSPSTNPVSSALVRTVRGVTLFALVSALWTGGALAQTHDEDRALARILADEGFEALNAGDLRTSDVKFSKALALYAAPTLYLGRGRAREALNQLVAAAEDYRRAMRFPVAPGESPVFARARNEAHQRLGALEARTPALIVQVRGGTPAGLTVNGRPWPLEVIGVSRPLDPGSYRVEAQTRDGQRRAVSVVLREGQSETAIIELPTSSAAVAPAVVAPFPAPTPPSPAGAPGSAEPRPAGASPTTQRLVPTVASAGADPGETADATEPAEATGRGGMSGKLIAMLVVTGVLTTAAVTTSVIYSDHKGEFDDANTDPTRISERDDLHDTAQTLGIANAILWGGAVISAGITTALLLAGSDAPKAAAAEGDGPRIALGPTGGSVRFRF